MMTTISKPALMVVAALGLSMGGAAAGEGNYEPFPNPGAGRFVVRAEVFNDTGSAGYIRTTRPVTMLANEAALPQTGSEGAVQTASSLPVGAEEGTVAYAQAMSVRRWVMAHAGIRSRMASR